MMDLELIKRVGIAAAYKGGKILHDHLGKVTCVRKKGEIDLVTTADTRSEEAIKETILSRFPDHSILAEETGLCQGNNKALWIIDPLDGTTNFAHQLPLFSVSIAFALGEDVTIGIVLNPVSGELFTAVKGKGAELNGKPTSVSDSKAVSESLLVTGFPYNIRQVLRPVMTRLSNCVGAAQGVRRLGSAALDLCYVACGRFDGFWEQNLKPWDTSAGVLIADEAGGVITDFSNQPFKREGNEILCTNGHIHQEMLSLLNLDELNANQNNTGA